MRKIYDYENWGSNERRRSFRRFDMVFTRIKENLSGIKGGHADALKIFINRAVISSGKGKILDLAELLARAAHLENREIFDYLMGGVNNKECCLNVNEKQELLGLALCRAVSVGTSLAMVKLLVESGAPVNPWPQNLKKPRSADDYTMAHLITVMYYTKPLSRPNQTLK